MAVDFMHKVLRFQGLSFQQELEGRPIDFENETVFLSLIPWELCNWNCQYCHEARKPNESTDLSENECCAIVEEAGRLGIRSLLLLGGEVLLPPVWHYTQRIVETAKQSGLIPVIFTNASVFNYEIADWMASQNVSLALKLDSLNESTYDSLTGRKGSFRNTMLALDLAKRTSIGTPVYENDRDRLVRLLLTTVGCSANVHEYASLARFSTRHGARWMMEFLHHRGFAEKNTHLAVDELDHSRAMRYATALNPEQAHTFDLPCRLLSGITIRKNGDVAICPHDYHFQGNIRQFGSLKSAVQHTKDKVRSSKYRENWTGICPLKKISHQAIRT